jgi:large subunit ribosomal protein L4
MLLPALLQQLRRELRLAPIAAATAAAQQTAAWVPWHRQLATSAAALQAATNAAAAASAAARAPPAASNAAGIAYPNLQPWSPPAPDHLQSRRRGYRPPRTDLGRRTRGMLLARYPFSIDYFSPKPVFLHSLDGRVLAQRELPGDIFNVPVRLDILHRVVRWQRAKAQQGTHKAKDRSEVRGGGRKPWRQKGTGRARQGSIRAPQWRGGGAVHGPVPRSHAHKLPKKVRRLGLKCALSAKAHEGRLLLLDSLRPTEPKTKELAAKLARLMAGRPRRSALLVDAAKDGADGGAVLRRAGRNLEGVDIVPACGANVYGILRRDVLILTQGAADALAARLRAPINRLGAAGRAHEARVRAAAEERRRLGLAAEGEELGEQQEQQQEQEQQQQQQQQQP